VSLKCKRIFLSPKKIRNTNSRKEIKDEMINEGEIK